MNWCNEQKDFDDDTDAFDCCGAAGAVGGGAGGGGGGGGGGYDAPGAKDTFTAQLADPGGEVTHSWASWQLLDAAGVAAWKGAKVPGVRLFDGALRLPEEILAELNLSVAKVSDKA